MISDKKLALLCQASYKGEKAVKSVMQRGKRKRSGIDVKECACEVTGATGYIAIDKDKKVACIVFRGTDEWDDWVHNLQIWKARKQGYEVHAGFLGAYASISERINNWVCSNVPLPYRTYITGHSLGGAMATLHAMYSKHLVYKCVTFGSPKVFEKAPDLFPCNIVRWVNGADIIARIPKLGYEHVGELHYITMGKKSKLLLNPPSSKMFWDRWKFLLPINRIHSHLIEAYIDKMENL